MYGSLRICRSPTAQGVFHDEGCTRAGESVLDFWYVSRGSTSFPLHSSYGPTALNVKPFKDTNGIS